MADLDQTIKELNTFLRGIHMGSVSFEDFEKRAQSEEFKSMLKEILESFKRHDVAISHRIESLGGSPADSVGFAGTMAELWEKMKLMMFHSDKQICEEAIKGIDMGIFQGNKFIEENQNLEESLKNDVIGVVKDYDNIKRKLQTFI